MHRRLLPFLVLACVVATGARAAADFGTIPPRPAATVPAVRLPAPERDRDLRTALAAYEAGKARAAYDAYLRAAKRGQPIGQYNVAVMKFNGEGTASDPQGARVWLEKAADAGFVLAQYNLGLLYENGAGVSRSQAEANRWYLKAAEQGHVEAELAIATQYLLGRGIDQDLAQAARWYEQAAIGGNMDAQYSIASCYEHGEGVPMDRDKAISWYAAAARQGDRAAIEKVRVLSEAAARDRP